MLEIGTVYWVKNFNDTFEKLKSLVPFDRINSLNLIDKIQKNIYYNAIYIYECEGYTYDIIKILIEKDIKFLSLEHRFFKLGYHTYAYKLIRELKSNDDFSSLEIKNVLGILEDEHLDSTIKSFFKKDTLEVAQCTYIKFKRKTINDKEIKKLVVTNPYTDGIIDLMKISRIVDKIEIKKAYINAINKLFHIKYYHIEAIYFLCVFLKQDNDLDFDNWYSEGLENSKKYRFSYLVYLFDNLYSESSENYNEDYYTNQYAPLNGETEHYLESYIKQKLKTYKE